MHAFVIAQVELLEDGEVIGYVSMLDSGDLHADAQQKAEKLKRKAGKQGQIKTPFEIKVRRPHAWSHPPVLLVPAW